MRRWEGKNLLVIFASVPIAFLFCVSQTHSATLSGWHNIWGTSKRSSSPSHTQRVDTEATVSEGRTLVREQEHQFVTEARSRKQVLRLRGGAFGSSNGSGLEPGASRGSQTYTKQSESPWWEESKGRRGVPRARKEENEGKPWWLDEDKKSKPGNSIVADSGPRVVSAKSSRSYSPYRSGRGSSLDVNPLYILAAAPVLLLLSAVAGDNSSTTKTKPKPKPKPTMKNKPKAAAQAKTDKNRKLVVKQQAQKAKEVKAVPSPSPARERKKAGKSKAGAYVKAAAILLAAASIGFGAIEAKSSNLLMASWGLPVDPWQVTTLVSFMINFLSVRVKGRLDGPGARSKGSKVQGADIRFFTPAGWAFAIWAPIFLGEMLFVIFQCVPMGEVKGLWFLAELSPFFSAAMLFQALWCAAFRPWSSEAGLSWLPAVLLGSTAVALGGVHGILVQAMEDGAIGPLLYPLAMLPMCLHFGWITAATLVNFNSFVASTLKLAGRKLAVSIASIYLACGVGIVMTLLRREPIFAAVLAWALSAVADERGWNQLKGSVDATSLEAQRATAKTGSLLMTITALVPITMKAIDVAQSFRS